MDARKFALRLNPTIKYSNQDGKPLEPSGIFNQDSMKKEHEKIARGVPFRDDGGWMPPGQRKKQNRR